MILLTAAKMPDGLDKDILADAVRLMFSSPQNKDYISEIQGRASDSSACESLFALALLYEQIRSLLYPVDVSELILKRGECGKPYFVGSDVKFNISHSKGYVVCASSVGEELGVDIEAKQISSEQAEKLANRYFNSSEAESVKKSPEIFRRIWSEKEATAKFLGESIGNILSRQKLSDISPAFDDCRLHSFSFRGLPITLCTKRVFSTISYSVQ